MDLKWQHSRKRNKMHREDVSTPNAIQNSIYRRCLNSRAFLNDPDVFLLRKKNLKFSWEQKELISKLVKLFGGVIFTSDDVSDYNDEQLALFRNAMGDDAELLAINQVNEMVFIDYRQNGEEDTLRFNITDGTVY